jgi:curved DNA-binding protein CbpA
LRFFEEFENHSAFEDRAITDQKHGCLAKGRDRSVLGLTRRANSADIRAAYRALAKQSHPDVNAGDMEAEQRTKDINRAYEILGDPEMRAAYDLELARYRAQERRSFSSAAAAGVGAGAVAVMLMLATLSMTVTWRQNADIRKSPNREPALPAGIARSERLAAKPAAEDRANPRSAGPAASDRGNGPSQPVNAPLPAEFGEPPASVHSEFASASLSNGEAQTRGEPTAQPSPIVERRPNEEVGSAPSSVLTSEVPVPETAPKLSTPAENPRPQTRIAAASPSEGDTRPETPAATAGQRPNADAERRDRNHAMIKRMNRKTGERTNAIETASTLPPSQQQDLEQEPRLVSSNTMALRWPSADEPFVNMGGRSR